MEPILVKKYEHFRSQYQDYLSKLPFNKELTVLTHQPISNDEKHKVLLMFLIIFLYYLPKASENSIKTFLFLVENMINGVEFPNPDIRCIGENIDNTIKVMQTQLKKETIMIILTTLAEVPQGFQKEKKRIMKKVLKYSQKEVIPEAIFLALYLLDTSNPF